MRSQRKEKLWLSQQGERSYLYWTKWNGVWTLGFHGWFRFITCCWTAGFWGFSWEWCYLESSPGMHTFTAEHDVEGDMRWKSCFIKPEMWSSLTVEPACSAARRKADQMYSLFLIHIIFLGRVCSVKWTHLRKILTSYSYSYFKCSNWYLEEA